jgi:hypothetical protein
MGTLDEKSCTLSQPESTHEHGTGYYRLTTSLEVSIVTRGEGMVEGNEVGRDGIGFDTIAYESDMLKLSCFRCLLVSILRRFPPLGKLLLFCSLSSIASPVLPVEYLLIVTNFRGRILSNLCLSDVGRVDPLAVLIYRLVYHQPQKIKS